ncbi:MAG: transcription antitermination factor NusB [Clostridia bacterium]|nr:transcription antitermination factor NusB [Clostridia bacterium]
MKLLYEWEMGGDGGEETRVGMLELQPGEKEADYMEMLVKGVQDNVSELDETVAKYAVGWKLDRIMRVDLTILRLAIFEITHTDLSDAISVNEALELARAYSTPEAVSFINGVLGSMLRSK